VRRVAPGARIVAVEPREEIRARALRERVADEAHGAPGPALAACEVVVLCTPVGTIEALLEPVSSRMKDGAILTDVGRTKEGVVARARERVRPGVAFVGAHPLFGGPKGYDGARDDGWIGGTVAVCTDGDPEATRRVSAMHAALGARVRLCTAAENDAGGLDLAPAAGEKVS
jgi:prephenate dehydrogenase